MNEETKPLGQATPQIQLATRLAVLFGEWPQVVAVALGGSSAGGVADAASDIDLYVYTRGELPLSAREAVVAQAGGASRADMGLIYFGPGDEWIDAATGSHVDAIYFDADWMAAQVRRAVVDHAPSLGYSTAFWHTVRTSRPLYDRDGWLAALQVAAAVPYPEPLRRAIVAYNHPILRGTLSSYRAQLAKAVARGDGVSINHRLAALLASTFDILFAVNRVPHPGEKRLLARAEALCATLPDEMAADVAAALTAAGAAPGELLGHVDRLLDRLDVWLGSTGFH
jgi:hypothetical protein